MPDTSHCETASVSMQSVAVCCQAGVDANASWALTRTDGCAGGVGTVAQLLDASPDGA